MRPTCRLEGRRLGSVIRRGVVDRDTALGAVEVPVGDLRDAGKGAVARLEVHVGGPVVGQILVEGAARAGRELRDVGLRDGGVEGILFLCESCF